MSTVPTLLLLLLLLLLPGSSALRVLVSGSSLVSGPSFEKRGKSGGVKQGRFVILRFPLFCSVWGSQDAQMLGNTARKVALSRPFLCAPNASKKLGFESSVPICWQAKHGENDKSTPFCPYTGGPRSQPY